VLKPSCQSCYLGIVKGARNGATHARRVRFCPFGAPLPRRCLPLKWHVPASSVLAKSFAMTRVHGEEVEVDMYAYKGGRLLFLGPAPGTVVCCPHCPTCGLRSSCWIGGHHHNLEVSGFSRVPGTRIWQTQRVQIATDGRGARAHITSPRKGFIGHAQMDTRNQPSTYPSADSMSLYGIAKVVVVIGAKLDVPKFKFPCFPYGGSRVPEP